MTRVHIRDAIHGSNYQINRSITDVPTGQTIEKAWLTMKRNLTDSDVNSAMQKIISTADVVGTGQITNPSDGNCTVRFDLHGSDWDRVVAGNMYEFDIQLKTSDGYIYPAVLGSFVAIPRVTQALA